MAFVHFHSRDYLRLLLRNRRYFRDQRLKFCYQAATHAVASVLEWTAFGRAARTGTLILTPSAALAAALKRTYGDQLMVRVLRNSIDGTRLTGSPARRTRLQLMSCAQWDEPSVIAVFVGGAWERKGLIMVLGALASLPRQLKLVVIGAGNVRHYSRVSRRLGVADRVHFAGPQRDVGSFLKAADFFVLPSWYEVQPVALLEAMACGLPVITGRWPGWEEVISEGVTGFAVSDVPSLKTAMRRLTEDEMLRRRIGEEARRAAQRFSSDQVAVELAARVDEVLRSSLGGRGVRGG